MSAVLERLPQCQLIKSVLYFACASHQYVTAYLRLVLDYICALKQGLDFGLPRVACMMHLHCSKHMCMLCIEYHCSNCVMFERPQETKQFIATVAEERNVTAIRILLQLDLASS